MARMPKEWILLVFLLNVLEARSLERIEMKETCRNVPTFVLKEILGPAFNYRYMRLESPNEEDEEVDIALKRSTKKSFDSFYVTDDFTYELSNEPAWTMNPDHFIPKSGGRSRRGTEDEERQKRSAEKPSWNCEARVRWEDLGENYFPRYLRSVECVQAHCYYGHYDCRPRFFTVRMLRRRTGECATMQKETVDLWVWEERSVAMCCDCVLRSRGFP
ncbi:Protein trunk [Sergentomyia squamirostris]